MLACYKIYSTLYQPKIFHHAHTACPSKTHSIVCRTLQLPWQSCYHDSTPGLLHLGVSVSVTIPITAHAVVVGCHARFPQVAALLAQSITDVWGLDYGRISVLRHGGHVRHIVQYKGPFAGVGGVGRVVVHHVDDLVPFAVLAAAREQRDERREQDAEYH